MNTAVPVVAPLVRVIRECASVSHSDWSRAVIEINGIKWTSEYPETAGDCQTINNQLALIASELTHARKI